MKTSSWVPEATGSSGGQGIGVDGRKVILAARLVDGVSRMVIEDPALFVEDGRIVRLATRADWRESADSDAHEVHDYQVHDYPGGTILPGLIDGHVHLSFSALATAPEVLAEYHDSDDVRLTAMSIENGHRCLAGGVTTVRDCGGPGTLIQSLRDAIAAGVTRGPRIVASGMPITTTGGHCHFFGLRADNEDEIVKAVRQLVEDDVDVVKVMATGGRMTRNSNIFKPQYTVDEMTALVNEASRLERRVASHALSIEGIRNSVAAGVTTIEHCNWQDEQGVWDFDEELLKQLAEQGTHVSVTLVGYMRDAYSAWLEDPGAAPLTPVLKRRFELEAEMFNRGLNAFISSDAGVPGSHFAELHRSAEVAVGWLGLEPHIAIEALTSRAAKAIGIFDEVGSVEVGKIADLIVVDGDPLADIGALGALEATYVAGERVVLGGAVLPTDPRRIGPRPATTRRSGGRHR